MVKEIYVYAVTGGPSKERAPWNAGAAEIKSNKIEGIRCGTNNKTP
jgi:hypothetical protein